MKKTPLEKDNVGIYFVDAREPSVLAQACYEAVIEIFRTGDYKDSRYIDQVVDPLLTTAESLTPNLEYLRVPSSTVPHLAEALKMYAHKDDLLETISGHPEVLARLQAEKFAKSGLGLRLLAGRMYLELDGSPHRQSSRHDVAAEPAAGAGPELAD